MTVSRVRNVAASVHQKLMHHAARARTDPNLVLTWYALERLLFRLSISPFSDRFVLKGGMLFRLWSGPDFRATRDLDLLGFVQHEVGALEEVFRSLCSQEVSEDDGLFFSAESLRIEEIREQQEYGGLRVSLLAKLGNARLPLQIDVGFGDAVTPAPVLQSYPSILGNKQPRVRVYPRETVVAEKYEAVVQLGMANSRMKDFYDLWYLSRQFEFDGQVLVAAIRATFVRRRTPIPAVAPTGLTDAFSSDASHVRQWSAFVSRIGTDAPARLAEASAEIVKFLLPASMAAATNSEFTARWTANRWRR